MAKKKVSLDFSKVKTFVITYGEKVALGGAGLLMVWLVLSGLASGLFSASKHPAIDKAADQLNARLLSADPTGKDAQIIEPTAPSWNLLPDLDQFAGIAWFAPDAAGESKLSNPPILPIPVVVRDEKKKKEVSNFQIDLVRAPAFEYRVYNDEVTTVGEGASAQAGANLARYIKGRQMLIVSATFPMKQQLELIRKALRKRTIADLLADKNTRPKWVGLTVRRFEVGADGKIIKSTGVDLYKPGDDKKPVVVDNEIDQLLKLAPYDGQNYARLAAHLQPGLATPAPDLAFGVYPEIKLPGIKQLSTKAGGTTVAGSPMPMSGASPMPGGNEGFPGGDPGQKFPGGSGGNTAKGGRLSRLSLKKMGKTKPLLAKQLQGEYNPFDPLGRSQEDLAKGVKPATGGANPGVPMAGVSSSPTPGGDPANPGDPTLQAGQGDYRPTTVPETALVRFIDPTVIPGKSYTYYVQIRMANPNYKKYKAVMYRSQAEKKELTSGWTQSPNISIPPDLEFFLVDRNVLPREFQRGISSFATDREKTLLQLHNWVKSFKVGARTAEFGSWAIAPRVYVHRGEYVGRGPLYVPMLEWEVTTGRFKRAVDPDLKKREYVRNRLVGVDFRSAETSPLIVDFKGGREWNATVGSDSADLKMLVLTPDGRLIQRSRRIDSDPNTPRGLERQMRFDGWWDRLKGPKKKTTAPPPTVSCGEE